MFFSTAAVFAALAASIAAGTTSRTFAVNHFYGKGPLVEGRMDPIVSPGTTSSHAHTIQGGNAFAETLGDTTLLSSTCTSSLIKNDKSVYWTPKMYFQDPVNGSFEDVPMFYMNVYYFFEATADPIVAFPQGLRMFVGNPELRTPPATGGGSILDPADGTIQPVQFTCPRSNYDIPSYPADSDGMHGVGLQDPNNQGAGAGFPDMNCDGYASPLRADIHFPSCYNPAAGLDDYKNNMAWPSSAGATGQQQNCPEGYIHTPHIFYEVYWNTPLFVDRWTQGQSKQPFVLSNGDNTGYSLHADFIAGWDVPTLQQIIDNCDAGDSGMDQCPGLIGGVNDPSTSCNIEDAVQETIDGVLAALPGNNPVTGWGTNDTAPAPPVSSGSAPSSAAAPASSGGSAASGYGGGYGYPSSSPSIVASSSPSAVAPVNAQSTPSAAGAGPSAPGYSAAGSSSSSTPAAPVYIAPGSGSGPGAASSSSTPAAPVYTAPGSGSGPGAASSSSTPAAPVYTAPGSGSGPGAASSSSTPAAPVYTAPGSGSGPAGSACAVATVTITLTAWYTPSASAGPSSTTTSPSSAGPTNPTISNWAYSGCYTDMLNPRVLSGIQFADLGIGEVTTTGCVAYCDAAGYSIAGTEWAGQCFCGNSLASASTKVADDLCNMACQGDGTQLCGGGLTLTVYTKDGSAWKEKRGSDHLHFGRAGMRRHGLRN